MRVPRVGVVSSIFDVQWRPMNVRNAYWLSRVDVCASLTEYDLVLALARTATCACSQTRRFLSFVRSRTGVVRRARLPKRDRS